MITARQEREASEPPSHRPSHMPPTGSEGARRELVRRIVNSPTFARSERLGALLSYVCDLSFKGRASEINEQRIGQAVFNRAQDYDSAVDGIVRSQASRLRQRLELYFQNEGADEPMRVSIPRGGYVPVFETQDVIAPARPTDDPIETLPQVVPVPCPQVIDTEPRGLFSSEWLPWAVTLLLAIMLLALWVYDRRALRSATVAEPATHPFWSHLFTRNQPTMVVAPDSGLVLYHGMSGLDVDLKGYMDAGYRSESSVIPQIGPTASLKDSLLDLANRRYTSIVDVKTILSLKDRAQGLGV